MLSTSRLTFKYNSPISNYNAIQRSSSTLNNKDMKLTNGELGKKILNSLTNEEYFSDKHMSNTFKTAYELGKSVKDIWKKAGIGIESQTSTEHISENIANVIYAVVEKVEIRDLIKHLEVMGHELEQKHSSISHLEKELKKINKEIWSITNNFTDDQQDIFASFQGQKEFLLEELKKMNAQYANSLLNFVEQAMNLSPSIEKAMEEKLDNTEFPKETEKGKIGSNKPDMETIKSCRIWAGNLLLGMKKQFTTPEGVQAIGANAVNTGVYVFFALLLLTMLNELIIKPGKDAADDVIKNSVGEQRKAIDSFKNSFSEISKDYENLQMSSSNLSKEMSKLEILMKGGIKNWEEEIKNEVEVIRDTKKAKIKPHQLGKTILKLSRIWNKNEPEIGMQIAKCKALIKSAKLESENFDLIRYLRSPENSSNLNESQKEEFKVNRKKFKEVHQKLNSIDDKTKVSDIDKYNETLEDLRNRFSGLKLNESDQEIESILHEPKVIEIQTQTVLEQVKLTQQYTTSQSKIEEQKKSITSRE